MTLVLHSVCLSKIFQRTWLSVLEVKADAKVSDLFFLCKFFRDFFSKKFFRKVSDRLSRSLAAQQGKILAQSENHYPIRSSCHLLISFPLESGCKGTDFFHSCNSLHNFFFKKIIGFTLTDC